MSKRWLCKHCEYKKELARVKKNLSELSRMYQRLLKSSKNIIKKQDIKLSDEKVKLQPQNLNECLAIQKAFGCKDKCIIWDLNSKDNNKFKSECFDYYLDKNRKDYRIPE